jgi:adenylosuccinate synthase
MVCTCVVGLQWGDEAKGKIVDLLTDDHDLAVRFNGGSNAGHTVVVNGEIYKLSLVPSAVLHPNVSCVIANGVAVNPIALLDEIDALAKRNVDVNGRLILSDRAHVILSYHFEEERLAEECAAENAIGTTRRGIGPCYADKVGRVHGIRVCDLLNGDVLRARLHGIVPTKNQVFQAVSPTAKRFDADELAREYARLGERLRPYVLDSFWFLQDALAKGRRILFEAAQGTLLDVDHGSYPYVTSSNSSACGVASGSGIAVRHITRVVGIAKAYTTRVGQGPFPTELCDRTGDHIREEGREYGTVTGRPRRCGWFDAVAGRYSVLLNGVDEVAVTLLDVLSKLAEIKLCEAYEINGERTTLFPPRVDQLKRCRPVYRTFAGWQCDIRHCRRKADLPTQVRAYLDAIAEYLQTPITLCSVGAERTETVPLA